MITDREAAITTLADAHKRIVRAVLATDNAQANAIFYFVKQEAQDWSLTRWNDRVAQLLRCEDKVGDWLATRL